MVEVSTAATPPVAASAFRRVVVWAGRSFPRLLRRNETSIYLTILVFVLGLIILAPNIFINVPAGHAAVLWLRFFGGTVTDRTYGEGVHLIFPWDEMYVYDARLQNSARTYDTISSNGLSMQVEIAVRYRVNKNTLGLLHALVGPDYPEILVYPEIGMLARELISRYTPEQLYSDARSFIQAELLEMMVRELGSSLVNQSSRGALVSVEDVLIRSVKLPDKVAEAIERKSEQYQAMLEYDFRIAREEKERERKRIEAEGIRTFQDIVARTITPEYLRLRGIEATMSLATSPNSKIIIIGGKDGLPVILNTGENPLGVGTSAPTAKSTPLSETASNNARAADIPPANAKVPIGETVQTKPKPAPPTAGASGVGAEDTQPLPKPVAAPPPPNKTP